ncbi:MAG TPA: hypothetical protein VMX76_02310 [Nevskiaceae bacterium]|nr:hypothetical protein [Nevskiaceae bacterium]
MKEIEPIKTFTGNKHEIHLWDDEEEITVNLGREGITGMVGPLSGREYPELFSAEVTPEDVDQAAERIIKDILEGGNVEDYGSVNCWSENFPVNMFYPYEKTRELVCLFSVLLGHYLQPSGKDGSLQPGDITQAAQTCIRELVNPNVKISFNLNDRWGWEGAVWEKEENSWEIEVGRAYSGLVDDVLFIEAHEAGHLLIDYLPKLLEE